MGYVMGLFILDFWIRVFGMSDYLYYLQVLLFGVFVGFVILFGIGLLIYWWCIQILVWLVIIWNDKLMYLVLVCVIVVGLVCMLMGVIYEGDMYDYWCLVLVWFCLIWMLVLCGDLMVQVMLYYQVYVLIVFVLFVFWLFI